MGDSLNKSDDANKIKKDRKKENTWERLNKSDDVHKTDDIYWIG